MQTPQYVPQAHIAFWLSNNDRFQVPKSPTVFLQQMRDGTLIWRLLTIHMADPPAASDSITERWRQIAAALLDCGTELTPHGLKLILLGDADVLDKVLNVLYSLHHAGGQGTSVVASLMTPCVPEPDVLYPKLFHSALVNAKQTNFVARVKSLTDGCCTADTKDIDRELLQLEALSSHSKRLVEYGLSEEFFRLALNLMNRQRATPMGLRVAALVKTFVYEVGPEASFSSLTGKRNGATAGKQAVGGRSSSRAAALQDDDGDDEPAASVEMLSNVSELLRSADALAELQDFLRLLVVNIAAGPATSGADASAAGGEGRLVLLLRRLFPCSVVGHAALIEQLWLLVLRVTDRSVVKALTPWMTGVAVAILEGRDPDHESYGRFNPNGRFEEGFAEDRGIGGMSSTSLGDGAVSETASGMPSARGLAHRAGAAVKGANAAALPRGDDDDDEGEDAVRVAKRTADLRLKLRKQQAHERHERDVCLAALRLCLRLWSECPDVAQSSDVVFDVMEFLKTPRGVELSRRPDLLCEIACAMFAHPMFYTHAMLCLEGVQRTPELRRMLLQNLCDYHGRPYPTAGPGATTAEDGGPVGGDATTTNAPHLAAAARSDGSLTSRRSTSPNSVAAGHLANAASSRAMQVVDLIGTVGELYPSIPALGHTEAALLVVLANCLVAEFTAAGPTVVSPQPTAGGMSARSGIGGGIGSRGPTASAANLLGASMTSSVDGGGLGGAGSDRPIAMNTVAQFYDLLVALFDQDPFFQPACVQPWMVLSNYFFNLPQMEPLRAEYVALCTTSINELLTLSERHPSTDLILQGIAQLFIEHAHEGRRTIAECVHMYFQVLVRRDPPNGQQQQQQQQHQTHQGKDAITIVGTTEGFAKKLKKLCELVGMPTTRVKVKVLDDEEAAKQAIIRRAEEEERKRVAAEEAERMRQEADEREEKLALEGGHERRKKYVRQPLYVAPEPPKPGELGRGSIFEFKRNLHWVKTNLVLGVLMDKVGVEIARRDYNKHVAVEASVRRGEQPARPVPESFWSGWQKGKKYEELQKEKRQEEEAEMRRREILRKIRDQAVKEKLKEESYLVDVKKLNQLLSDEQQHVFEEESDGRSTIRNAYLKVLVALYHMFRDENGHLVSHSVSAHRRREEALKKQQEEERTKAKEKVAKYWEEKEFLEAQLLLHRQQEEEEDAKRQEARKRQYLDEQKRKLMSWRLQNQYDAGGGDSAMLSGISSTSTTMSDGPGHPRHNVNAKAKKKSLEGGAQAQATDGSAPVAVQAYNSSPHVARHASVPRLNANAASGAKLPPMAKKQHGGHRKDSLTSVDESGGGGSSSEMLQEGSSATEPPGESGAQGPPATQSEAAGGGVVDKATPQQPHGDAAAGAPAPLGGVDVGAE